MNESEGEPSGTYGAGAYVLRLAGQGRAGIRGSGASEGTEAVMGRCVGKGRVTGAPPLY